MEPHSPRTAQGRVDRYGQPAKTVRVVTYYGLDNQIDGLVLDVLIRRHKAIRSSLGVSVPVPANTNQVIEAVVEGLLLRSRKTTTEQQGILPFGDWETQKETLFSEWEAAADREKRSRTMFAQETIKPAEVLPELEAVRAAIGSGTDVGRFTRQALRLNGAVITERNDGQIKVDLSEMPRALRERIDAPGDTLTARFDLPVSEGVAYFDAHAPGRRSAGDPPDGHGARLQSRRDRPPCRRDSHQQGRAADNAAPHAFSLSHRHRQGGRPETATGRGLPIAAFAGSPQNAEWLGDGQAIACSKPNRRPTCPPSKRSISYVKWSMAISRSRLI